MPTVNWMWFGNHASLNATPNTPSTRAEANSIVGYTAEGADSLQAVAVTGNSYDTGDGTQAFTTTFSTNRFGWDAPNSTMTYTSPHTEAPATTEITGFLSVSYRITMPGDIVQDQTGVLIQMSNGDMFFRPSLDSVEDWKDIDVLRSIEILSATPLPASTWVATVSFNADIFETPIVCFTAGTLIRTNEGHQPVEDLAVGDLVWTRDHGDQPIRWRGARRIGAAELAASPNLRPIRIRADALGQGVPATDLVVSPQHRILVRSAIATRMFGAREILVPAKQLLSVPGIDIDETATEVTYVHLMLERHEVLMSNGAETESLYPGPMAIAALGQAAADEIFAIFPELAAEPTALPGARPFIAGKKARKLAERHAQNQQPLHS